MKKITIFIVSMIIGIHSCNVIDQEPLDAVSNEQLFTRPSDAEAAIIGVYRQLTTMAFYYVMYADLPTKNTVGTALNRQFEQMNNLLVLDDNPHFETIWTDHYLLINRANVVIARVPEIPGLSEEKRDQLVAEARLLRAFAYFSLVRSFRDVALVTARTTSPDVA